MERPAKLRKLNQFRRKLPHISANALDAVLATVAQEGIPDLHHRDAMREARDLENKTDTPFGPILQSVDVINTDGNTQAMPVAHPFALLWTSLTTSKGLRMLFQEKFQEHPPTPEKPWNLVLYSDEVTPGNPLATMNNKKSRLSIGLS